MTETVNRPQADGSTPVGPPAVPRPLASAAAWSWRALVVGAAVAVAVFLLAQLSVVVVPVVLALFLAAVLEPPAAWLRERGLPAGLAAAVIFLGTLTLVGTAVVWISTSVAGQFDGLGRQLTEAVDGAEEWARGAPLNLSQKRIDELDSSIRGSLRSAGGGLAQHLVAGARAVGQGLGALVLLLFTLFFLLKDGAGIADWMRARLPPGSADDVVVLARRTRSILRQYLLATAATGAIDAVLIGIALALIGVPLVIPLAVLTFVGGFIPILGATVAGAVATIVALTAEGWPAALLVAGSTIAVQQIEGNFLQPLILERAVRLHPLVTVWSVAAGLIVAGLLGAFLAVPLVAIGTAVAHHYRCRPARPT